MASNASNPMPFAAQIENVRSAIAKTAGSAAAEDFRVLAEGLVQWQAANNPNPPAAGGGVAQATQAAPSGVVISVAGANGVYTVHLGWGIESVFADVEAQLHRFAVMNHAVTGQNGRTVWFEVSYSATKSFSTAVTTLPVTAATQMTLNLPGETLFFRVRASYDRMSWSEYVPASQQAVSSGLVTAAVQDEAVAFNQTNYAVVTSEAVGGAAVVKIAGASGPASSLVRQKGSVQSALPGAVVANVPFGVNQFVGYSEKQGYALKPTLADVLADNLAPIGKVSVVDTGVPTLPQISLVLGAGGAVLAWNVTDQGNGITGPLTLAINTSTGTGATPGQQTIENGKLISIAPGNPGQNYGGGDTVTAAGGIGQGAPGGGTASGGNGGRMTAV